LVEKMLEIFFVSLDIKILKALKFSGESLPMWMLPGGIYLFDTILKCSEVIVVLFKASFSLLQVICIDVWTHWSRRCAAFAETRPLIGQRDDLTKIPQLT